MLLPFLLCFPAFAFAVLLTPACRAVSVRLGFVDTPDDVRKLHPKPVPRTGGVAVLIAYTASLGIVFLTPWGRRELPSVFASAPVLLTAGGVVFITGLWDDLRGLKPWLKLAGQALGAATACASGLRVEGILGVEAGVMAGTALTMIWLVGCTNAFNLIDGLDGLASGLALLATVTMLVAALLHGDRGLVAVTAPLAGVLLGFLIFNFNPASIFLGDCGSLWLGFILGCYGVIWSQKSAAAVGLLAPIVALSVPLLDTSLCIARRFLRRQPIFSADHAHIHHRLLDRGLTPKRVVFCLYMVGGLAACLSLVQVAVDKMVFAAGVLVFAAGLWAGVKYLGYREFGIAADLFVHSRFRSTVRSCVLLDELEQSLRAANTTEECWLAIVKAARSFGLSHVVFVSDGTQRHQRLSVRTGQELTLHIPLSHSSFIKLTHPFDLAEEADSLGLLAQTLHRSLAPKAEQRVALPRKPAARDDRVYRVPVGHGVHPGPS